MSNGTAALQLFTPEPASLTDKSAAGSLASHEIDVQIGEAVADGVIMLCRAIVGHQQTGALDPETKDAFAGRVAAVVMLQLDHGSDDDAGFILKARQAGHTRLHRYFDGYDIPPDVDPDTAINLCLDEMLGLVSQIVRTERVYRVAWAN